MRSNILLALIIFTITSMANISHAVENTDSLNNKNGEVPNTINWYKTDFPPYYILNGPEKGKGILGHLYHYVVESLPQYDHQFFISNNPGFLKRAKSGHNVCATSLLKTPEREKYLHFSTPYLNILQNAIFIRYEDIDSYIEYITADGRISLSNLIMDQTLILGVKHSASYGGEIDKIIDANKNNKNVIARKGRDLTEGLLKMLRLKRIDYMIAYDESIEYLIKKLDLKREYLYIPIAEMPNNQLNQVSFCCAKNGWGGRVIQDINKIIAKGELTNKSKQFYMRWLGDVAKKEYLQILREKYE